MTTSKRAPSRQAVKKRRAAKRAAPYHHGSLREAMLRSAESILERDGIGGLTLRAAAREAGVSHAPPKNHFGDVIEIAQQDIDDVNIHLTGVAFPGNRIFTLSTFSGAIQARVFRACSIAIATRSRDPGSPPRPPGTGPRR